MELKINLGFGNTFSKGMYMNTLSNVEILKILKDYGISINGIFSKDLLPIKLENGWYIVNLQNHNEGNGTHWVCCYKNDLGKSIYSDSFGICPPTNLEIFLKPFIFNNREIQNLESSCCGWFCIALIKYIEANKKKASLPILMKRFSNGFSKNTILNDGLLKSKLINF